MMVLDACQHKGSTVQVRRYDDGERFVVRATDSSGKPLNGYMYSVSKIDHMLPSRGKYMCIAHSVGLFLPEFGWCSTRS